MTLARELADTAGRPQVDKNLLINGGMNVWQRSTLVTGIASGSNGYDTVDRWGTYTIYSGTWTQSRSTDVPSAQGFGYSLKMDCTTIGTSGGFFGAYGYILISQRIEAQNLQHLLFGTSSPKSITLSFWVKSNKTGTYIVNLLRPDISNRHISKSYTINTANTWEKKEIVIEGDETNVIANDNGYGIDLRFWLRAGTLYQSGTLQTSWGAPIGDQTATGQVDLSDSTDNEWYLTGCQLEVGEAATDFQFESYESVLRKCQRYYEIGKIYMSGYGLTGSTDTHCYQTVQFASQKRVAPSITKSSTSYTNVTTSGGAVWTNPTTLDVYDDEQIHSFTAGSKIGTSSGTAILKANYDFSADSEL